MMSNTENHYIMMSNTENPYHRPLISLRSRLFKKSKRREQNCEQVRKISEHEEGVPSPFLLTPSPLLPIFFSPQACSFTCLLARSLVHSPFLEKETSATQAILSFNINIVFKSSQTKNKVEIPYHILHITDFKGCFCFSTQELKLNLETYSN